MNQSSRKLLKQASDGLIAHLYEHVIAKRIDAGLFGMGFLSLLDYDLWATTKSRVSIIDVRFQNLEVKNAFKQITGQDQPIATEEIRWAIEECACEYKRKYAPADTSLLLKEVNILASDPWIDSRDFSINIADKNSSVDTIFSSHGISYGRRSPQSFTDVIVEYVAPEHLFADQPELKPLAMFIIQAIAINQIRLLASTFKGYDAGDDWQAGVPRVAYRHWFTFKKTALPVIGDLERAASLNYQLIMERHFTTKVQELLMVGYKTEEAQYFSDEAMHTIAGIVIGSRGWAETATLQNIELILERVKTKIIHPDGTKIIKNAIMRRDKGY